MTITNVIPSHLKFKLISLGSGNKKRKKQKEKKKETWWETHKRRETF